MQKKKNIRLLIILTILIVVTTLLFLYQPNSGNIEKNRFTLSNLENIDRVEITNNDGITTLTFEGRQWKLNNKYIANIARINDLFVIFEKVSAKRKISKAEQAKLEALFKNNGATINIYSGDIRVKQLQVVENEKGTLSYFIDGDGIGYVCAIVGNNYHIADLFNLDEKGWRSHYVFSSNWTTLEKLEVSYPDHDGFGIHYSPTGYYIENINELDTAKMYNYLELFSFLQVEEYLEGAPRLVEQAAMLVTVNDTGGQSINLAFYQQDDRCYGWIDSAEWATFNCQNVQKLMQTKNWFERKN